MIEVFRERLDRRGLPAALVLRTSNVLCFDGVFSVEPAAGLDGFHYTGDPAPAQIERLLAVCIARVDRLLRKRGVLFADGGDVSAPQ